MRTDELDKKAFHPIDAVVALRDVSEGNAVSVANMVATELENYCAFVELGGSRLERIDIPTMKATNATEKELRRVSVDGFSFNGIMQDFDKAMESYEGGEECAWEMVKHCRLLVARLKKYTHYCRLHGRGLPVFPFGVMPMLGDVMQEESGVDAGTPEAVHDAGMPKRRGRPPKSGAAA